MLAATQLGLTEAPVIVLGHLTEAPCRACRIADIQIRELGKWDEALLSAELQDLPADDCDLSLVGFPDGALDTLPAFDLDGAVKKTAAPGRDANTPVSSVDGGRMVHVPECAAWTWDARPWLQRK